MLGKKKLGLAFLYTLLSFCCYRVLELRQLVIKTGVFLSEERTEGKKIDTIKDKPCVQHC